MRQSFPLCFHSNFLITDCVPPSKPFLMSPLPHVRSKVCLANVFLVIQRLLHLDAFPHQVSKLAFLFPDASPITSFATRLTVSVVSSNSPGNTRFCTSTSITFYRNAFFARLILQLPPTRFWIFFTITSHGVGSLFLHTTILCCLATFSMLPLEVSYGYRYIFYSCCLNNWCTSYKG